MKFLAVAIIVAAIGVVVYKYEIHTELYLYALQHLDPEGKAYFQLASINYTEIDENFDKVSKELLHAFKNHGFAYLTDVPDIDSEELRFWLTWFFDLPLDIKLKIAKNAFNDKSASVYRGYAPVIAGGSSFKELLEVGVFERKNFTRKFASSSDIRNQTLTKEGKILMRHVLQEKNVWPITNDPEKDDKFREVLQRHYQIFGIISRKLFHLLIHALGFEKTQFDHMFKDTLSTLRSLHYPTRLHDPSSIPQDAFDGDQAITTAEHFDTDVLTVLATFNYSGLQVKPKGFNKWLDVPVDSSKLIINSGSLLESLTEGIVVSTNHRVLDIGIDRYSIAMFHEFNFDADVSKTFFGNPNHVVGKFKKYGPWMTNRTSQFSEAASTDFGVAD